MKILFINNYNYLRGGSEHVFFNEMALLRKHGHEVSVFSRKSDQDITSRYTHDFPEDIRTDKLTVSWRALKNVKEIIYSGTSKKAIARVIESFNPDLIHAHNIYGRLTTSVLDMARSENIPAVMTLHDYKLICPSYKLFSKGKVCEACRGKSFYKTILKKCHKKSYAASAIYGFESYFNRLFGKYSNNLKFLIAPSLFLKKKLIEYGWREQQIAFIPNYLSCDKFEPKYKSGAYLLYVGRLSAEKGISTLIRAFRKIKFQDARLLIAGDGPIRTELEALANGDGRTSFLGHITGEPLKEIIRNSKAVVVPSEWYENAPISILESFASGKPVIGSNLGGIPEMVENGKNGFLFQAGNIDNLKETLESTWAKSGQSLEKFGMAARRHVEQHHNETLHYIKLMDIYRKSIEAVSTPGGESV